MAKVHNITLRSQVKIDGIFLYILDFDYKYLTAAYGMLKVIQLTRNYQVKPPPITAETFAAVLVHGHQRMN